MGRTSHQIVAIDILHTPPEAMQMYMDAVAEQTNKEIDELANNLGISVACAADVWCLRTRSSYTPELEIELIRLHKEGNPPKMGDFG